MLDYTNLRSTAINLLKHFGNDATLTRTAGDTFNPATGAYTGGSTVTITGKAVRMIFAKSEVNGITIQTSDVRLLFQAGNGAPLINDNCLFAGINYRVMDIMSTSPAGTDVYYDIQLRH